MRDKPNPSEAHASCVTLQLRNSRWLTSSAHAARERGMRRCSLLLMFVFFSITASAGADQERWELVGELDGIRVSKREVPGHDLPAFRGETTIAASMDAILSVLVDWRHHTEWAHRCAESTLLRQLGGEHELLMYYRTDLPWPAWDRDVIYASQVERSPDGSTIVLMLRKVESDPRGTPSDVVRMPRFYGAYKLVRVGEAKTRVTYEAEVDPGGSLPRWIVQRVVRDIPHETLAGLRARAAR